MDALVRRTIRTDAVMRLHAAVPDGGTNVPRHPDRPDGAPTVTARSLAAQPELLRKIVDAVAPGDPAYVVTEYFVRPLVRVFRRALDRYGLVPADPRGPDATFELTPDLAPTGRVLITEPRALPAWSPRPAGVPDALGFLAGAVADAGADPGGFRDVLAAEMRFLRPDTARLLAMDGLWRDVAHSVPREQEEALARVLARVRERARDRPRPLVAIGRPRPGTAGAVPGLARFCRDVRYAGGDVVFPADGPAEATAAALRRQGVAEPAVVTGPPRADAVAYLSLDGTVPPGIAPERVVTVADLEMRAPATAGDHPGPALSAARSVAALRLETLRPSPAAVRHAVRWTAEETGTFVRDLAARTLDHAPRTAHGARAALRRRDPAPLTDQERAVWLVHHILQRKRFKLGPAANYPYDAALRDMLPFVRRGEPIRAVMTFFPNKLDAGRLKAAGHLPDLAELAMLIRVREIVATVRQVYPPGMRFLLAADGHHYRDHPRSRIREGMATMVRYAEAAGALDGTVRIVDFDEHVRRQTGTAFIAEHRERRARILDEYRTALAGLDITAAPVRVLRAAAERDPRGAFAELFRSLLFSVSTGCPAGDAPGVYADLYDVGDGGAPAEVAAARKEILRTAWDETMTYVATWHADALVGYRRRLFPGAVPATVRPRPGMLGLSLLGGTARMCWHATGAIDPRGIVSCDFAVALRDQGFVDLYSPLLGPGQPFAMVPVTATQAGEDGGGARLDPAFLRTVHLRRK